jgi:hypothetical protein
MVLAAIHWPFSSEVRFRSHVSLREICGGRSGNGTLFLRVFPFFPVNDVLPVLCTYLDPHCSYQMDKRAKPGNIPTSSAVSEIRENSIEK